MPGTRIKHTAIVLFPLGKLKAENTTRTFVRSRSSMGAREQRVGSAHTKYCSDRKRERKLCVIQPPPFCSLLFPSKHSTHKGNHLIQVRERLLNQPMANQGHMLLFTSTAEPRFIAGWTSVGDRASAKWWFQRLSCHQPRSASSLHCCRSQWNCVYQYRS